MQKILGYMRKAIDEYNMIENGDRIAVALSGGKDSTTMLLGLKNLQRFYPKKFEIIGITINPGFEFFDSSNLRVFTYKRNSFRHTKRKKSMLTMRQFKKRNFK